MSKLNSKAIGQELKVLLGAETQEINQTVKFSQRHRQLDASQFVLTTVLGWTQHPAGRLIDLVQTAHEVGSELSPQGLDKRFNEKGVALLAGVLQAALKRLSSEVQLEATQLGQFSAVYISDSTQVRLPKSLREAYPGTKKGAQVKCQVSLDYLTGTIHLLELSGGKVPDQKWDPIVQQAQPNSLNLFDRGYFKQEHLRDIHDQGAYYVTRHLSQIGIYTRTTGERLYVQDELAQLTEDTGILAVTLGQRVQTPAYLVYRRRTSQEAKAARRQVKDKARQNKQTCSAAFLALQDWEILVTNLPADQWSVTMIFALYTLRWQIELIFRTWKSQLKLAHLGNWRPVRILCQLYAHLIAGVLWLWLLAPWRWSKRGELSWHKALPVIQRFCSPLLHCWLNHWRGWSTWYRRLGQELQRVALKDKRKTGACTPAILMDGVLS